MAALTPTFVSDRVSFGRHVLRTIRFTIANANAADEWVATGLSRIVGVIGIVPHGTADVAEIPAIVLNAQGTGVTAETNLGDLGVEGNAAVWDVTVFGVA